MGLLQLFFLLTGDIPICLGCSQPMWATFILLFQDLAHVWKPSLTLRFASNVSRGFHWAEQKKNDVPHHSWHFCGCLRGLQWLPSPCNCFPSHRGRSPKTCLSTWPHPTCIAGWVREDIRCRLNKSNLFFGEYGIGMKSQWVQDGLDPRGCKLGGLRGVMYVLHMYRKSEKKDSFWREWE